jgi:protein SCO1
MRRVIHFCVLLPVFAWIAFVSADELPSDSIYRLDVPLTTQDGELTRLPALAGHVRIVTMFYASCPYVCPITIETLKYVDAQLSNNERAKLRVLLVSVDPERDTPKALASLAAKRQLDLKRWSLARPQASDVRKIAAVLGIQYRQLPDKEFNHSTTLALISADGRIVARSNNAGTLDLQFLTAVHQALADK